MPNSCFNMGMVSTTRRENSWSILGATCPPLPSMSATRGIRLGQPAFKAEVDALRRQFVGGPCDVDIDGRLLGGRAAWDGATHRVVFGQFPEEFAGRTNSNPDLPQAPKDTYGWLRYDQPVEKTLRKRGLLSAQTTS